MAKINNKKILIGFFVLLLYILMYILPVFGDDLLHGSVGNGFFFMPSVNGRYLGNFFGINLSSSVFLRVIVKGTISIIIVYLIKLITGNNKKVLFLIPFSLFLFMPKEIFRQVIALTSGYGNYVMPTLGILLVIFIFFKKNNNENKLLTPIFLILGIINSLFVEHITIYNLLLSIFMLLVAIKNKKQRLLYSVYLLGSLIGTYVMFSNPVYLSSFLGTDNYRSISKINDILKKISSIVNEAYLSNYLLMFFQFIIIYVLTKNTNSKHKKIVNAITVFNCIFIIYYILTFLNPSWELFTNNTIYFNTLFAILFFLNTFLLISVLEIRKEIKNKLLIYLISYVITLSPLLFVNPVGPRCYFTSYIFMILYIVEVLLYLDEKNVINIEKYEKFICIIVIAQFVYYFSIYGKIYVTNKKQINDIMYNINAGKTEIKLQPLPYMDYLHGADMCDNYVKSVFKKYYRIPENIELIQEGCY